MKLTIAERFHLLQMLPTRGSIEQAILCEGLKKKLPLTEEERSRAGIRPQSGGVVWQKENDFEADISISAGEADVLRLGAELLSAQNQFPTECLATYQRLKTEPLKTSRNGRTKKEHA